MKSAASRGVSVRRVIKNGLLPRGPSMRSVRFGIGRGAIVPLDFAQHTRLYLGLYEVELNRFMRRFCTPGLRSFDVGAQIGYDSLILARLTGAPVLCFESDADLARRLATTFAANHDMGALIAVRHAAVGRFTGSDG